MKRSFFLIICGVFFSLVVVAYQPNVNGSIQYIISMDNPHTHYFTVEIHLKNYKADFVDVKMPVWTPGSYLVREYAKNVEGFSASRADGKSVLDFNKINKNTWRVFHHKARDILIKYKVYAFEGSVRMSYLDEDHAFIMANTLIMYVEDLKNTSFVLELNVPDRWNRVSTSLTGIDESDYRYDVPNYDILVDSPIEVGNHDIIEFSAAGVVHEIAMYGKTFYNKAELIQDISKIIEASTAIFGENPNDRYVFIIHNSEQRSGGLEHLSSTVLGVNRWAYTQANSYKSFLSLVAHEYFHLWMVKRLKPVELEILDYDNEIYTDLLWVMEGITSYYDQKIMLNCGFHSDKEFITGLLSAISSIQNTPGAEEQSVAEASFDSWIKYYRKNENSNNSQISYYKKGMILGALLDLQVINGSKGEKSLDDVLRELYLQYYKKNEKGITNDNLMQALEKASNTDLTSFFNEYVYGTVDLDYEKFLHLAGIGLVETNGVMNSKSIGITYSANSNNVVIASLKKGGSAYDNGLNVGDELISINEFRVNPANIKTILEHFTVGQDVTVFLSRDGLVLTKTLDVRKNDTVNYTYEMLDSRTKQQDLVYNSWFGR